MSVAEARDGRVRKGAGQRALEAVGAENLSLLIALAILVALIASQSDAFFSSRNMLNIAQNMAVTGLVAVGMTMVIVSAGLDISAGSIAGVAGVVCALLVTQAGTLVGGVAGGIAVGALLGLVNASIINYLRVNPVVATLATLSAFRGVAFLIAPEGKPIGVLTVPVHFPSTSAAKAGAASSSNPTTMTNTFFIEISLLS